MDRALFQQLLQSIQEAGDLVRSMEEQYFPQRKGVRGIAQHPVGTKVWSDGNCLPIPPLVDLFAGVQPPVVIAPDIVHPCRDDHITYDEGQRLQVEVNLDYRCCDCGDKVECPPTQHAVPKRCAECYKKHRAIKRAESKARRKAECQQQQGVVQGDDGNNACRREPDGQSGELDHGVGA